MVKAVGRTNFDPYISEGTPDFDETRRYFRSRKQHHTIAQGSGFLMLKIAAKFQFHTPNRVPDIGWVG